MKPYFSQQEILELHSAALHTGLVDQRTALLHGISPGWTSSIQRSSNPAGQLLIDLHAMNTADLADDSVPFDAWLSQAAQLTLGSKAGKIFVTKQIALRGRALGKAPIPDENAVPEHGKTLALLERQVLGTDSRLPYTWLIGGVRTGASVLKLEVARYNDGVPSITHGTPDIYGGTGWVLAPGILMTCRHVIEARGYGDAPASLADVTTQALGTKALVGYDSAHANPKTLTISRLLFEDADLDVALLEIREETPVLAPLVLRRNAVTLGENEKMAVNIIQHPAGRPKLLGFRNNLLAGADDLVLRYYTDTDPGSSGAPLCNDAWQVIGIHRASELTKDTKLAGVTTTFINTGHQLAKILEALHARADLWPRLAAGLSFGA